MMIGLLIWSQEHSLRDLFSFLEVAQDVPRYMMVSGERAELRGLNLEGLRRRGFSAIEVGVLFQLNFNFNDIYY